LWFGCWFLSQITQPEKPKDSEKQTEGSGYKIDEKKLAEIPIKARGLLDMDDEVACPHLFILNLQFYVKYFFVLKQGHCSACRRKW